MDSKSLKTADSQTPNRDTKAKGMFCRNCIRALWLFLYYLLIDKKHSVKMVRQYVNNRQRWVLITEGIGKGKSINFWRLQYEPKKYFRLEAVRRAVVRKQTYRKV